MDATKTGSYLAMLRKARGMTQQEAADRLGISNKTVSKWESGGGFPDITVLPALAELYGVTADDILAGETLTDRRMPEDTSAQRRRLLARLRVRFDVCFAISLALAGVALLRIPYVSLAALPLSLASVWIGFVLVSHPIRYGGVETDAGLYENLFRKLLTASLFQWFGLVQMLRLGAQEIDWSTQAIRGAWDDWKPVLFCAGVSLILLALSLGLRRTAGAEARLLPRGWQHLMPWLLWGVVFLALWQLVDGTFEAALAPWVERYGKDVLADSRFDKWPILKARRDAELLPYLRARRGVLAAGGVSGLGLLAVQVCGYFRKKRRKSPAE